MFKFIKLVIENNTLKLKLKHYEKLLKDQAFKLLMEKVGEPFKIDSLNNTIKHQKDIIKDLRQDIKDKN